jgi:hypothetical protein
MEEMTKIKKDIIELRIKVEDHDQTMVGISMLEDKVDEHHEILVNRSSFITFDRLAFIFSIVAVIMAMISIVMQILNV